MPFLCSEDPSRKGGGRRLEEQWYERRGAGKEDLKLNLGKGLRDSVHTAKVICPSRATSSPTTD